MFSLIVSLLTITVAVYLVFFLIFKLIWVLLKKTSNKWPLILSGILTLIVCGLFFGLVGYFSYKFITPFNPIIKALRTQKEPIVGVTVYKDPIYKFELDTYDSFTFGDWINTEDVQVKFGITTNIALGEKLPADLQESIVLGAVLRYTQDSDDEPFEEIYELVDTAVRNGTLSVESLEETTHQNMPALRLLNSNSDKEQPLPITDGLCVARNREVYCVVAMASDAATEQAKQMVNSLRFE